MEVVAVSLVVLDKSLLQHLISPFTNLNYSNNSTILLGPNNLNRPIASKVLICEAMNFYVSLNSEQTFISSVFRLADESFLINNTGILDICKSLFANPLGFQYLI